MIVEGPYDRGGQDRNWPACVVEVLVELISLSSNCLEITMHKGMARLFADYGMLFVLLLLCMAFSMLTVQEQHPTGFEGARKLAERVRGQFAAGSRFLLVASTGADDRKFVEELNGRLAESSYDVVQTINGGPPDVRRALADISRQKVRLDAVLCNKTAATWSVLSELETRFPDLADVTVMIPLSYRYPAFLKPDNLRNVAGQSAVIAIIGIGMTMVIITAGIDLSAGSLVALAAVVTAIMVRDFLGGVDAHVGGLLIGSLTGIAACALVGLLAGLMITSFDIPPFVVTLAMMSIGRGWAQILAEGQSVYQVPESFSDFARVSIGLMLGLYVFAHILMRHTALGRYIYAVGGNREAARLSGVPVRRVLLFVYTVSGALAGLGGVIEASRLMSASPLYGRMLELDVIAAVVVGGTSLAGGQGNVVSTLIGALIIGVIRNGMNLMNIETYTQGVVMGLLILCAVVIDSVRKKGICALLS